MAATAQDGRLLLVDVASGQVTEVARSSRRPAIEAPAWSPDSAWLAWSEPVNRPLGRIRLIRVAGGEVVEVTDGRFADTSPVFTADGLYLAFLSQRSFDPVYDAQTFDLSFPLAQALSGAAGGGYPVAVRPGARRAAARRRSADEPADEVTVTVDPDGLAERVVAIPADEARYRYLRPVSGGLVWLRTPLAGVLGEGGAGLDDDRPRAALQRFDLRKREVTELAGAVDWYRVSGDGTRLVIRDHDELRVIPSARKRRGRGRDRHRRPVPGPVRGRPGRAVAARLRRGRPVHAPRLLGPGHVRRRLGRRARRSTGRWWTGSAAPATSPTCSGRCSASLAPRTPTCSRPAAESASTPRWACSAPTCPATRTGRWVVDRVLPGESSDPRARSPLTRAGCRGRPGRRAGRGGRPAGRPPARAVAAAGRHGGQAGRADRADPGPASRGAVVIVPLRHDRRLRYQDWVAGRRQVGARAQRRAAGLPAHPGHDGGGLGPLPPRPARRDVPRRADLRRAREQRRAHFRAGRGEAGPPGDRLGHGPLAAAGDLPAGSPARPAGHRGRRVRRVRRRHRHRRHPLLGLGPVVGTRTWGGVIGIEGHQGLVDGIRDHRAQIRVFRSTSTAGAWRITASTPTSRC